MEIKLILTKSWTFKLRHYRQLLHYKVWSLCNHLQQFSMNRFQTLYAFCLHYKDMHVKF